MMKIVVLMDEREKERERVCVGVCVWAPLLRNCSGGVVSDEGQHNERVSDNALK